jgi:hypothetical protein
MIKYTAELDAKIIKACKEEFTMHKASLRITEVCYQAFRRRAIFLNCWVPNMGAKGTNKNNIANKFPLEDILLGEYPGYSSHKLRIRLIEASIKEDKCECCGISNIWNGKKLSLQLNHIDGNSRNNLLSNLEILCPNCHTQTDTYGSKKLKLPR